MKKLLALIMTVSGVLVLTGCAVEPVVLSQKQSELIASTWSYGEGTEEAKALRQPPDKWWAAWHDESLTYLVKATLENNTDIAQAQANLRAAQASLLSTTSALFPS